MADEIEQRLDIEISASGAEAEQAFSTLDDSAKATAETIAAANTRIAESATTTSAKLGEQARAAEVGAKTAAETAQRVAAASGQAVERIAGDASRAVSDLRRRFADDSRLISEDTAKFGADTIRSAADRARENLKQAQVELADIRDDARAGIASPHDVIASTRAIRDAATIRPNGESFTRTQLQERSLAGDDEARARYRQYVEADRQLIAADNELTEATRRNAQAQQDSIASLAQQRANAYREQLRTGQITLEEERTQLQSALRDYEHYAQARNEIDKRLTDNSIKLAAQRNRETGKQKGEIAGAVLNTGYILPGAVGNIATNLGYGLQGGPVEAAALVGATAAVGIGGLLAGAATVAAKDQEAMERLGVAIKAQGADWNALSKQVADWTELQERTTTFGRSQTVPALNELAVAGVKLGDAFKIVRVAEDASAATGKPLAEVTHQLLEAYNGNSRGLIQLGVVTRDQIKDGMSLMQIFGAIEKTMSDQATSTNVYAKQQIILQHDIEKLSLSFGESLLPVLTEATKQVDHFVRSIDGKELGRAFVASLREIAKEAREAYGALAVLNGGLNDLNKDSATAGRSLHDAVGQYFHNHPVANDPLTSAMLRANGAAAASFNERGGGGFGVPQSLGASIGGNLDAAINAAAAKYGISAALLRAVGQQESGLGRAAGYDQATGLSRTPGNAGHGVFQLDPASGATPAELSRAARDVGYAADKAAQMLAHAGAATNPTLALATYNAGGPNAKGLQYAQEVLGRLGPTSAAASALGANPVDTNVVGRQNRSGQPQYQTDLAKAEATAQQERLAGVADWRKREEDAIQSILAADTLSAKQRAGLEKQLAGLQIADQKDVEKAAKDAATARERELRSEIGRADTQRVRSSRPGEDVQQRQAAYEREIHELERIRDLRAQSSDAGASKDVDTLNAKIARLTNESAGLWTRALDEARKHYKASSESLDEFLAKLRQLERGTGTDQKRQVEAIADGAIVAAVKKVIADFNTAIRQAEENGLPRSQIEALQRGAIGTLSRTSNRGNSDANDALVAARAALTGGLDREYGQDATDKVRDLDRQYKELATDVSDAATARGRFVSVDANAGDAGVRQAEERVRVEREQIALVEQHIRALQQLAAQYQRTYGSQAKDAVDAINRTVEGLQSTEHDQIDAAQRDERASLQARSDEYRQFARTAADSLASIWSSGENGIHNFAKIFKSVFRDLEQSALKSGFAALLGQPGAAGGVSFTNSLEKSLFGSVAPAGFSGGGGASPVSAASAAVGIGGASPPASADFFSLFSDPRVTQQVASNASQSGLVGAIIGTSGAQQVAAALPASVFDSSASSGGVSANAILLRPIGTTGANGSGNVVYGDPSQQGGSGGGSALFNPFKGGAKAGFNNFLGGFGTGEAAVGITGGNQLWGGVGSAAGSAIGGAVGGPVGAQIGGALGGALGGLFGPHWGPASNYPDRSDTQRYGTTIAELVGQAGANGQTFYESQTTKSLFAGGTGLAGVEKLLAGGQAAFAAQTGIQDPKVYQQALADFGASATGSGQLQHGKHIGDLSVTGASGASGVHSYTELGDLLARIEQGLQSTGAGTLGALNTYTVRRALPDYNLALGSGAKAVQEAIQSGGAATGPAATGSGAPGSISDIIRRATSPAVRGSGVAATESVVVDARNSTFVGADGASGLADLITQAQARKRGGTLPNPYAQTRPKASV